MEKKYSNVNKSRGSDNNENFIFTDVNIFKKSFEQKYKEDDFVLYIVGPTASGKSALAHQLAKKYNGAIICADSRTIFKGMDVGTAKPSRTERAEIDYYCLDMVDPNQRFTVANFKQAAEEAIVKIKKDKKMPIVVGGSGLYIDALLYDYSFRPEEQRDTSLESLSTRELIEQAQVFKELTPDDRGNRRRLVKIIQTKGIIPAKTVSLKNSLIIGLCPPKNVLQERIGLRIKEMFREGVVKEAESIAKMYGWETEAMTGNIYRIAKRVLEGQLSEEEAINLCIQADKKLVKKQLTWFRRNGDIQWFESVVKLLSVL